MKADLAIIGDRFVPPSIFEAAIRAACGDDLTIQADEMPWPDVPMQHGYAVAGMDGLKEYFGGADETLALVGDASTAVTHLAPFSAAITGRLPNLRLIAASRGGPVNIDMAAARERKSLVVNTPGRNASAVAEFTLGAILAGTRLITRGHEALRRGEWRGDLYRADLTGSELSEMTVGVVGYGQVGTKVVRILKAVGCKILVCDPYVRLSVDDIDDGVEQVSLERIVADSDVVTLHARGPLVDYAALTDALRSRHLRGAAIETVGVEPVPAERDLLRLDNVKLTPHIAGASPKTVKFAPQAAAEEARRFLAGQSPLNPC